MVMPPLLQLVSGFKFRDWPLWQRCLAACVRQCERKCRILFLLYCQGYVRCADSLVTSGGRSTAVKYEFFDGDLTEASVNVNQRVAPAGNTFAGWLGRIEAGRSHARLSLCQDCRFSNRSVSTDAMRLSFVSSSTTATAVSAAPVIANATNTSASSSRLALSRTRSYACPARHVGGIGINHQCCGVEQRFSYRQVRNHSPGDTHQPNSHRSYRRGFCPDHHMLVA